MSIKLNEALYKINGSIEFEDIDLNPYKLTFDNFEALEIAEFVDKLNVLFKAAYNETYELFEVDSTNKKVQVKSTYFNKFMNLTITTSSQYV